MQSLAREQDLFFPKTLINKYKLKLSTVMLWTNKVTGGPRRVNHAAVGVPNKRLVFTFGGYCTGEEYNQILKMDVHIFDACRLQNNLFMDFLLNCAFSNFRNVFRHSIRKFFDTISNP